MKKTFIVLGLTSLLVATTLIVVQNPRQIGMMITHSQEYMATQVEMEKVELGQQRIQAQADAYQASLDAETARVKAENARALDTQRTAIALERAEAFRVPVMLAWGIVGGSVVLAASAGLWLAVAGAVARRRRETDDHRYVRVGSQNLPMLKQTIEGYADRVMTIAENESASNGVAKIKRAESPNLPNVTTYAPQTTNTYSHYHHVGPQNAAQAAKHDKTNPSADETARAIMAALSLQGLNVVAKKRSTGPMCNTYSIKPANNGKGKRTTVAQIKRHADDIAVHLGVMDVRISQAAGFLVLEVPREDREMVALSDVLSTRVWRSAIKGRAIPIALGKDSNGEVIIIDLAKAPHMLIGGATGMGKSVLLRTLITCLGLTDGINITLIDPKRVEFGPFRGQPNVVTVASSGEDIDNTLNRMIDVMDYRGELFEKAGVVNIQAYNNGRPDSEKLAYEVCIIDEIADLFMTSEVAEEYTERLCQKARFAGIHMVLATQRPDSNTVSPLIRTNVQTRLSVRCSAQGDSKVILGEVGAEKLLNRGDSLYKDAETALTRIQTAYTDIPLAQKANLVGEQGEHIGEHVGEHVGEQGEHQGEHVGEHGEHMGEHVHGETESVHPDVHPVVHQSVHPITEKCSPVLTVEKDKDIADLVIGGNSNSAIVEAVWGTRGGKRHKARMAQVKRVRKLVTPHMR